MERDVWARPNAGLEQLLLLLLLCYYSAPPALRALLLYDFVLDYSSMLSVPRNAAFSDGCIHRQMDGWLDGRMDV